MNSEKVKEIKKALEDNANYENHNKLGYIDGYKCKTVDYADILTLIGELESENKELRVVTDIANERTYRKKFTDEWRKEYQKELDKQGNGHIAGHPDFDLVYKLYFDQKDRIAELESENETIKLNIQETEKASFNINQMNGNLVIENQTLKDRIAELEKENALIKNSVAMRDYKTLEEISNNKVKQFAEMLKEKMNVREYMGVKYKQGVFSENDIDETLMEYEK